MYIDFKDVSLVGYSSGNTTEHDAYEVAVERAKKLFLDGYILVLGLSGKDSGAASVCIVEGMRRAKLVSSVMPLYVVTTNTRLDNMVLHDYMLQLHDDLVSFGKDNDLPIFTKELNPALSETPMVMYVGRGKLLHSPKSGKNRSCAVDWKIKPMIRFLDSIKNEYQTDRIVAISGSRDSESVVRRGNLARRQEDADRMVMTDLGWSQPIIKDWSLNDVWNLFKLIDDGEIESYSDRFDVMRKHYSAANNGTCDLFSGDLNRKNNKSCGSRFGCVLCNFHNKDNSLEAQIDIAPQTYGFMKPLNQLRNYMANTLFDYSNRSIIGRSVKDGFVKLSVNEYSLDYRMDLLRYILTIQADTYETTGEHLIDLIDYSELCGIQYHWSRTGGEKAPGMAFKIWHEVVNEGKRYPLPVTEYVEEPIPKSVKYFHLDHYVKVFDVDGLDDDGFNSDLKHLARQFRDEDGDVQRVVRYSEDKSFNVITENALAMDFVECFYLQLVEDGLDHKCPTVMLKNMLESGVIQLSNGRIKTLHKEVKRAQALNILSRYSDDISLDEIVSALSVSKDVMDLTLNEISKQKNQSGQQSFF